MDECFIKTCLTINVFINLMRGCALMSWNWVMAHIPQQQQPGYFIFFCLFFKKVNFESYNFELCPSLDLEQFCSILAKIYLFSSVNVQLQQPHPPVRTIWKIHYVLQTSRFIYLFSLFSGVLCDFSRRLFQMYEFRTGLYCWWKCGSCSGHFCLFRQKKLPQLWIL